MKHKQITVEQLSDLAQEAEDMDPIDWQEFNTTKEFVYRLMASAVIGISQTRKTLKAPALTSLKREEYKRVLKYILNEPLKFKG